jgi:hypothetical protein
MTHSMAVFTETLREKLSRLALLKGYLSVTVVEPMLDDRWRIDAQMPDGQCYSIGLDRSLVRHMLDKYGAPDWLMLLHPDDYHTNKAAAALASVLADELPRIRL